MFFDAAAHYLMLYFSVMDSRGFFVPSQDGNVVIMTIYGLTGMTHIMMAAETTPCFINYFGRAMHLGRVAEWTSIVYYVVQISSKLNESCSEAESVQRGLIQLFSVLAGTFAMIITDPTLFCILIAASHVLFFDIFRDFAVPWGFSSPSKGGKEESYAHQQAQATAKIMAMANAVIFTLYTIVFWQGACHMISDEIEMTAYSVLDMLVKGTFTTLVIKARVATSVQTEHEQTVQVRQKLHNFVHYALHELRVPLNTMSMATEELKSCVQPTTPEAKAQRSAIDLLESMQVVVSGLLSDVCDFQSIAAGGLRLEEAPIFLPNLVGSVIDELQPIAKAKSLTVHQQWEGNLSSSAHIIGDRFKLEQVLRNLVENATKFSPDGNSIIVRTSEVDEATLKIDVVDHGVGISAEDQKRLFKPFSQIDPGKLQNGRGTGLGLYISREIVRAHKGTMSLDSKLGSGSTFSFTLPRTSGPEEIQKGAKEKQREVQGACVSYWCVDDSNVSERDRHDRPASSSIA
eukprot:CAMPEP_0170194790 /NCGR_PEP_ID=MMETSP0040_2-20121228/60050_1 /TAXON_ID=641309 /ORGANISM="Lotharella oceanica, Strain CCMP622" /LENGTH=515 /DNA_ID=CAMNT_0010443793 /DNA_START=183 /DNA_END=1730 /DNA_ORIENTATION=+